MADNFVQIIPDSTGKKVDAEILFTGVDTVFRQRIQIASAVASAVAGVVNSAPAGTEFGLVVRPIPSGVQSVAGTFTDVGAGKTLKRYVTVLSTTGNLVSAVTSKVIKVFGHAMQSRTDSMTAQYTSNSGGTALTARWAWNAREGRAEQGVNPPNFFLKTAVGEALAATIVGSGQVDFEGSYWDDDSS